MAHHHKLNGKFSIIKVLIFARSITISVCVFIIIATKASLSLSADHINLADTHNANGNTCEDCHGDGPKKPVPMQKCLSCHKSYAKVATRTQDLDPNPHDSHLIDLACTKCHQGHKPQVNYCQTCHADMEFKKK